MYSIYDRVFTRVPVPLLAVGAAVFVSGTVLLFEVKVWVTVSGSILIAAGFFSKQLLSMLHSVRIRPNHLTLLGLCTGSASGLLLAKGMLEAGLVTALLCCLFDVWDGLLARRFNMETPFGGVLDSVLDRMADGMIFGGLAYYLLTSGHNITGALAMYAAVSAQIVSYVRARAEARIDSCEVNAFGGRPERLFLLCYSGVTGYLEWGLVLICIFQTITILRRIHYTYYKISRI